MPSLADVVPGPSWGDVQMRRPSVQGQASIVATPTNEIRHLSFQSEASRPDDTSSRTSDHVQDSRRPPPDHNLPPIFTADDMKRVQYYDAGPPGSAHSPRTSSGSSAFGHALSPTQSQHHGRSLPSPPTSHFPQSGLTNPSQFTSSASQAAHASHLQDLQHQISTKTLALQTLQREHDQLLAAFSRSQIRCNTLDKKSRVSDHEINTLTEEKIRLQQQVDSLEAHVNDLAQSRDEVHKQSTADGAQWRQIMAMSSQLQVKGAEDAKQHKADRDAWEQERTAMQQRLQELECRDVSPSRRLPPVEGSSSELSGDPLDSSSLVVLRQEIVRGRQRCAELEHVLQDITGESEQIDAAIQAMANIRKRVASKTRQDMESGERD